MNLLKMQTWWACTPKLHQNVAIWWPQRWVATEQDCWKQANSLATYWHGNPFSVAFDFWMEPMWQVEGLHRGLCFHVTERGRQLLRFRRSRCSLVTIFGLTTRQEWNDWDKQRGLKHRLQRNPLWTELLNSIKLVEIVNENKVQSSWLGLWTKTNSVKMTRSKCPGKLLFWYFPDSWLESEQTDWSC